MNTRELQSRLIEGQSRAESVAHFLNTKVIPPVQAGIGVGWFAILGKWIVVLGKLFQAPDSFYKNFAEFIQKYGKYLFLLSFAVSLISWIVTTVEFITASNKNLGKIAGFLYSTFYLSFYFAIATTFILAGPIVGGIILYISMFIDPAVNLGRAIFYGIKAALEHEHEKKYYFKHRALSHGMAAGVGGIISLSFALLMIFTTLSLGLAVTLGILGVGLIIATAVLVPKIITRVMGTQPSKEIKLSIIIDSSDDEELVLLPDPLPLQRDYYANVLTELPLSLTQLGSKIKLLIQKIGGERNNDRGTWLESFWPQESKRRHKIEALVTLHLMIEELEFSSPIPDAASEENPYLFMGHHFHYTNKNEFCAQVKQWMISRYNGVFQSTYKKTGDVECCFNELFLCIINNSSLLYRDKPEEKDSLRSSYAF